VADSISSTELFLILLAGIVPPLVWLWFWLKEDKRRPEPRSLLLLTFFGGAFVVLLVLPFQALASKFFVPSLVLLLVWATIEEIGKYAVAFFADFRRRTYDEPLDAMIYLITAALGFAAFENVLFLLKSISQGGLELSIVTASMRFLGASLLHVFSSAIMGGIIATSFYKTRRDKLVHLIVGLLAAAALHTLFNFFIMNEVIAEGSGNVLAVFAMLWVGVLLLLLFFEKVKNITRKIA